MVGACAPKGRAKFCGRCRYNSGTRTLLHTGARALSLSLSRVSIFFLPFSGISSLSLSLLSLPLVPVSSFISSTNATATVALRFLSSPSRPPLDSFHLRRPRCSRFDSFPPSPILLALHPPKRFFLFFTDSISPSPSHLLRSFSPFCFSSFSLSFCLAFFFRASSAAASALISDA